MFPPWEMLIDIPMSDEALAGVLYLYKCDIFVYYVNVNMPILFPRLLRGFTGGLKVYISEEIMTAR